MRYVNLMGGQKPHLLVKTVNNLGAETRVQYAPSTKFYLQDKRDGKPWITRLPFPVHVVEHVETYDHISRNRFVTRYAYHHGYFDGIEREFCGFGMVEQWDTEEIGALTGGGVVPEETNIDTASHVPPVHTKTWFHTGVYLDREHISRQFEGEYYREPGLNDQEFRALLLPDTTLPTDLTREEEREACRALKGMMLRQEVYADDAPPGSSEAMIQRARTPYTVVEQDFTIRTLYRKDDLTALLPLGVVEPLALPGESYKLAFTLGLLAQAFQRSGQPLLPNPANVLGGQGTDRGGYRNSQALRHENLFPPDPTHRFWTQSDVDDHWWWSRGGAAVHRTTWASGH
jgi:hypothetical protein